MPLKDYDRAFNSKTPYVAMRPIAEVGGVSTAKLTIKAVILKLP